MLEGCNVIDGPSDEPRDIIMEGPKPMVLSRAQSQCPKTTTYLSSDLKAGSPNGNVSVELVLSSLFNSLLSLSNAMAIPHNMFQVVVVQIKT